MDQVSDTLHVNDGNLAHYIHVEVLIWVINAQRQFTMAMHGMASCNLNSGCKSDHQTHEWLLQNYAIIATNILRALFEQS